MSFLRRYELFGWDYALHSPPTEAALAWYRRHARDAGGPVLEVACGTGPLLAALAADGHGVVGLDLSAAMLDLARRRIGALPQVVQERVTLVRADMTTFDLGRSFPLAIVADNSLRESESHEGMLTTLRRIRSHLVAGGRLLVAERRFDARRFQDGVAEWPGSEPVLDPATGDRVTRRIRVELSPEGTWTEGVMTYRTVSAEGGETTHEFRFRGPVLGVADYLSLFRTAGFDARLTVGYSDRPDDGIDPVLCFACVARGA